LENDVLSHEHLTLSRMIHNLDKIEFSLINNGLKQLNLSNIQSLIIIYLTNKTNSEVFQKDLEKEFGVTNPTMTVSIKSMIKKDLLFKEKSLKDGRYFSIHLTEKGASMYQDCMKVYEKVDNANKGILTPEEEEEYRRLTNKLINGLD